MIKKKIVDEVQSEVIKFNLEDTTKNSARLDNVEALINELMLKVSILERRLNDLGIDNTSPDNVPPSNLVALL